MTSAAKVGVWAVGIAVWAAGVAAGQDWSQWRGVNRDGKVSEFTAPATWPTELTKKWQVPIGDGVATPALVGDRLYVFSRQDGNEIARCLDAASGEKIWQDSYASEGTTGGASGFQGPRCSPTVVDGKVITLGVRGILSCLDAATGNVLWRKDDFQGKWPMFYTASSPIVADNLCIAELGGSDGGGIVAYDLATGEERWRWTEDGPSYGSPVSMTVAGTRMILAPTEKSLVGVAAADGKLLWRIQFTQGRMNSATPIVDGQTMIVAGPGSGMSAIALESEGDALAEEQLWNNTDNSLQFNTPVFKDGFIFGLSNNGTLFCINADTHETAWSAPLGGPEPPSPFGRGGPGGMRGRQGGPRGEGQQGDRAESGPRRDDAVRPAAATEVAQQGGAGEATPQAAEQSREGSERRGEGRGRGRGRGGRGGGGGGRGYGSIVDAGAVLLALTPNSELVVFEPSATEFKELARYKVAETPTYAYPVASGNRIFVKDQDSVTLWMVE
jgi:outer membrane protein assembly factor BamB